MKTIEEIAVIAAARYDNPFDEPAYDKKFYDGFIAGANHIMSLPLSERITAEEKEKIKGVYKTSKSIVRIENDSTLMYSMHTQIMCVLESIFGKSMFEWKGGNE